MYCPPAYCITMTPLIIVSCVNVYIVNVRRKKWWKSLIMSSIYIVSLSCWPTLRKTVCMPLVQSGLAANIWEYSFSSIEQISNISSDKIEQISNISSDRSNTTDPGGNYLRFSLDPMSKYFLQITLLVEIFWNWKKLKSLICFKDADKSSFFWACVCSSTPLFPFPYYVKGHVVIRPPTYR